MTRRTRIAITGATGRTGNAVAHALVAGEHEDIDVVALVAPSVAHTPSRPLPADIPAFARLQDALEADPRIDVIIDLTHADAAVEHLELALQHGCSLVLGTTGLDAGVIAAYGERFAAIEHGLLQVPNFSLGAVLAMQVAEQLARHFPDVEIVETHHEGKRDAPSGTALLTAERIAAARNSRSNTNDGAGESPARGERREGVPIHSLRLAGSTAHQEVVFGGPGELVTIRHDAIDRSCYATGVALAARRANELHGLEIGLEHAL